MRTDFLSVFFWFGIAFFKSICYALFIGKWLFLNIWGVMIEIKSVVTALALDILVEVIRALKRRLSGGISNGKAIKDVSK